MPANVVALVLDTASATLIDRWTEQRLLPHLAQLRREGAFGHLSSQQQIYHAEPLWTTLLTGCPPAKTGYWTHLRYDAANYHCATPGACEGGYDFRSFPPFYAGLGEQHPVAIFDIPQAPLRPDVAGVQVLGWGAHAPMTPSHSQPTELLAELINQHGDSPLLHHDALAYHDPNDLPRFLHDLEVAIDRRGAILSDLLQRTRWSLVLAPLAECHGAQHYLWHLSQTHTVSPGPVLPADDPLLRVFRRMDDSIKRITDAAGPDATLLLFTLNSSQSNHTHLGANVFLPELLFRWNFPDQKGLGGDDRDLPLPKPRMSTDAAWWYEVWQRRHDGANPWKFPVRSRVPLAWYNKLRLERLTGPSSESPLLHRPPLFWLPASWYAPHWPRMRAFALPSAADGCIRLNVKGRDAQGVVEPQAFQAVCDTLKEMLRQVRDARKGERLVREVVQTRSHPLQEHGSPDADLVVLFDDRDCPADTVDSPTLGRIGPFPFYLSGGHQPGGFCLARGPGIPANAPLTGDVSDMTATLLHCMGVPAPAHVAGRPLQGLAQAAASRQAPGLY